MRAPSPANPQGRFASVPGPPNPPARSAFDSPLRGRAELILHLPVGIRQTPLPHRIFQRKQRATHHSGPRHSEARPIGPSAAQLGSRPAGRIQLTGVGAARIGIQGAMSAPALAGTIQLAAGGAARIGFRERSRRPRPDHRGRTRSGPDWSDGSSHRSPVVRSRRPPQGRPRPPSGRPPGSPQCRGR